MDKNRRKFLKVILIGSGTLIMGKILGPLFSRSLNSLDNPLAKNDPKLFRVFENEEILSIYDDSGVEVFQIDKRG